MSEEKVREHETDCTCQLWRRPRRHISSGSDIEAARTAPKQIYCRGNKTGRIKVGLSISPA